MPNTKRPEAKQAKEILEKQKDELVINIIRFLDYYSSLASKESLDAVAQILQRAKQEIAYWSTDADYRKLHNTAKIESTKEASCSVEETELLKKLMGAFIPPTKVQA